jgi:hypothetical protein
MISRSLTQYIVQTCFPVSPLFAIRPPMYSYGSMVSTFIYSFGDTDYFDVNRVEYVTAASFVSSAFTSTTTTITTTMTLA